MSVENDIRLIVEEYKVAAKKYGEHLGVSSRLTNKCFDKIANCYKRLQSLNALNSLSLLIEDPNDSVRLWAGSHLLLVMPELGEKVLEDLHLNGSLVGFSAKMAIQEWKKGRLKFDY